MEISRSRAISAGSVGKDLMALEDSEDDQNVSPIKIGKALVGTNYFEAENVMKIADFGPPTGQ